MSDLATTAKILKALGNKNRLIILRDLKKRKSITVSETSILLGITIAAASVHLKKLEKAGILTRKKRGQYVTYRLLLAGEAWVKKLV